MLSHEVLSLDFISLSGKTVEMAHRTLFGVSDLFLPLEYFHIRTEVA